MDLDLEKLDTVLQRLPLHGLLGVHPAVLGQSFQAGWPPQMPDCSMASCASVASDASIGTEAQSSDIHQHQDAQALELQQHEPAQGGADAPPTVARSGPEAAAQTQAQVFLQHVAQSPTAAHKHAVPQAQEDAAAPIAAIAHVTAHDRQPEPDFEDDLDALLQGHASRSAAGRPPDAQESASQAQGSGMAVVQHSPKEQQRPHEAAVDNATARRSSLAANAVQDLEDWLDL